MPWEDKTVEELREEFIAAREQNANFSQLCREYGISRKTGYKWLSRSKQGLPLSDESRRPHHFAGKTVPEIERTILEIRTENPGWGARKIREILRKQGYDHLPCTKTVNNILKRNGCISEEESLKHKPCQRFEKDFCNEMWQADFKGEFLMKDGRYCYPLDILDDTSRFLIMIQPSLSSGNLVKDTFERAFLQYGMPNSILSDNGAQFAGFRRGYTQFEKWLMNHDVLPIHGRFKHPQTQGKIERLHRSIKEELLTYHQFENLEDADRQLQEWREKYNTVRPHEALGMKCPAEVYHKSTREYKAEVEKYEYSGKYHVLKVNSWGYVRFMNFQVYLSETMRDEQIEFRPNPHGDSFFVCYRNYRIAELSATSGKLLARSIARL